MGMQRYLRFPILPFAVAVIIAVAIPVATISFLKGAQSDNGGRDGAVEPSLGDLGKALGTPGRSSASRSASPSASASASPSESSSPSPSRSSTSPEPPASHAPERPAPTSASSAAPAPQPVSPPKVTGPPPAPYLTVRYGQTSEWDDGFTADFVLYNKGNDYARTWKIVITLPRGVVVNEAWDMDYRVSGQTVTFTPTNFRPLAPGGRDYFGFQAYSRTGYVTPTSCTVDGHSCTG